MFTVLSAFTLERKDAPPAENPPLVYVQKRRKTRKRLTLHALHSHGHQLTPHQAEKGQRPGVQSDKSLHRGRMRNCCTITNANFL